MLKRWSLVMLLTAGFPKMNFEKSEKRDFLPSFFGELKKIENSILLEKKYGEKLGYTEHDYLKENPNIKFVDRIDTLRCDLVTIIRTISMKELDLLKDGSTLFSMLHYITHKKRNELLNKKNIKMFSMDSVTNDFNERVMEDFSGTAKSAINAGFQEFIKKPHNKDKRKIIFTIIGSGKIGQLAVFYAVHSTDVPVIVKTIGKNVTSNKELMQSILKTTDILVDATKRTDTCKYVVENELIKYLPESSVIVDISADEYDTSIVPMQVKGIEGIVTGSLDKFVFHPDDKEFDSIPKGVNTANRRTTISCYSWPGIDYISCLKRYEIQLIPLFKYLLTNQEPNVSSDDYYERCLARSTFEYFSKTTRTK